MWTHGESCLKKHFDYKYFLLLALYLLRLIGKKGRNPVQEPRKS